MPIRLEAPVSGLGGISQAPRMSYDAGQLPYDENKLLQEKITANKDSGSSRVLSYLGKMPLKETFDFAEAARDGAKVNEILDGLEADGVDPQAIQMARALIGNGRDPVRNQQALSSIAEPVKDAKVIRLLDQTKYEIDPDTKRAIIDPSTGKPKMNSNYSKFKDDFEATTKQMEVSISQEADMSKKRRLQDKLETYKNTAELRWMLGAIIGSNLNLRDKQIATDTINKILKNATGEAEKGSYNASILNKLATDTASDKKVLAKLVNFPEDLNSMYQDLLKTEQEDINVVDKDSYFNGRNISGDIVRVEDKQGKSAYSISVRTADGGSGIGAKMYNRMLGFVNDYLKDMSGAAVTTQEAQRLFAALGLPEISADLARMTSTQLKDINAATLIRNAYDAAAGHNVRFFPEAVIASLKELRAKKYEGLKTFVSSVSDNEGYEEGTRRAARGTIEPFEDNINIDNDLNAVSNIPSWVYSERASTKPLDNDMFIKFRKGEVTTAELAKSLGTTAGWRRAAEDITYFRHPDSKEAKAEFDDYVNFFAEAGRASGTAEGRKRVAEKMFDGGQLNDYGKLLMIAAGYETQSQVLAEINAFQDQRGVENYNTLSPRAMEQFLFIKQGLPGALGKVLYSNAVDVFEKPARTLRQVDEKAKSTIRESGFTPAELQSWGIEPDKLNIDPKNNGVRNGDVVISKGPDGKIALYRISVKDGVRTSTLIKQTDLTQQEWNKRKADLPGVK